MNKGIEMSTSHDPAALLTDAIKRLTLPGDIETVFVPMPTKLVDAGWSAKSRTPLEKRFCTECKEEFQPKRKVQKRCGQACMRDWMRKHNAEQRASTKRYSREGML